MNEGTKGKLALAVIVALVAAWIAIMTLVAPDPGPTTGPAFPADCVEVYGRTGMECG